jgi:hypothetical protein
MPSDSSTSKSRRWACPTWNPLEVPALRIGAGTGPVAFEQNYKDVLVSGFTKLRCSAAA